MYWKPSPFFVKAKALYDLNVFVANDRLHVDGGKIAFFAEPLPLPDIGALLGAAKSEPLGCSLQITQKI